MEWFDTAIRRMHQLAESHDLLEFVLLYSSLTGMCEQFGLMQHREATVLYFAGLWHTYFERRI